LLRTPLGFRSRAASTSAKPPVGLMLVDVTSAAGAGGMIGVREESAVAATAAVVHSVCVVSATKAAGLRRTGRSAALGDGDQRSYAIIRAGIGFLENGQRSAGSDAAGRGRGAINQPVRGAADRVDVDRAGLAQAARRDRPTLQC